MPIDIAKLNQGIDKLTQAAQIRNKIVEMTNLPTDTPPGLGLLRVDGNPNLDLTGAGIKNAALAVWQAQRDAFATAGRDLIVQAIT